MTTAVAIRPAGESAKALPRKIKFTVAGLAGIRPPVVGRTTVFDRDTRGLCYVVTSRNARSFYLYRRIHGRPTRLRLGGDAMTVAQAKAAADMAQGAIAGGTDPAEERRNRRRAGTLGELWTEYLEQHLRPRATAKTLITHESRWETCLEPWSARKALDITPADVRQLHAELGKSRGKVTANRAVQLLRSLFNFGRLGYQPVNRGEVAMFKETSRSRFLTPDEMRRFLVALADISVNPMVADIVKLSLFTGCRRANAEAARAEEFDVDAATWTIPASKSKNGQPLCLPLVPAAVEIVKRRSGHESGFLFPSFGRTGHIVEPKASWTRILELAKLSDVHFHDCRRTFASWQAAGGVSLQTIGKSLGHRSARSTEVYSRLDLQAVRQAATQAVGAMLAVTNEPVKDGGK